MEDITNYMKMKQCAFFERSFFLGALWILFLQFLLERSVFLLTTLNFDKLNFVSKNCSYSDTILAISVVAYYFL